MLARKLSKGGNDKIAYIYVGTSGDVSNSGAIHSLTSVNGNLTYNNYYNGSSIDEITRLVVAPEYDCIYGLGRHILYDEVAWTFSISNRESPTIFDTTSVSRGSNAMAVDYDNGLFFTTDSNDRVLSFSLSAKGMDNIDILDSASGTLDNYASSMIAIPSIQKVFVADHNTDDVYRYDYTTFGTLSNEFLANVPITGFANFHMAYDDSRGVIFQSNVSDILVRNTALYTSYGPFNTNTSSTGSRGIAHNDTLQKLLVAHRDTNQISCVDTSNLSSLSQDYVLTDSTNLNDVYDLVVDWDNDIAYAVLNGGNGVTTIDISDLSNMSIIDSIRNENLHMSAGLCIDVIREDDSVVLRK